MVHVLQPCGLISTTRALPGVGAVGLALVEDNWAWTDARCWPLQPRPDARIYEITGPDPWIDLVNRYPLDVSRSRRHEWWRVTGWADRWAIPDWQAVAADYHAVHLTVTGYLTTAGRALPTADGRTVLAGWDPDQTWWLTDTLTPTGVPDRWHTPHGDDPLGWRPTPDP